MIERGYGIMSSFIMEQNEFYDIKNTRFEEGRLDVGEKKVKISGNDYPIK